MQECTPNGNWSMAAILGLEDKKVEEICDSVKSGFVVPANYNCPGQIAISGDVEGVKEAIEKAKETGAKKAVELKTSGPFHTEKLEEASKRLFEELKKINIDFPKIDVVKNIDGMAYKNSDNIKEILAKHVINPVRFAKSAEYMIECGIDIFVEIGPRKNFNRICKKN